ACLRWLLLPRRLGKDLAQPLGDVDAVLDRRVELEMQVGREAQVLQPAPELVPDQALGALQAAQRFLLLLLVAEHAEPHPGQAEIRGHADLGDADEPDPRVLQLPADDVHDLLPDLASDLVCPVAGHPYLQAEGLRFLRARAASTPGRR